MGIGGDTARATDVEGRASAAEPAAAPKGRRARIARPRLVADARAALGDGALLITAGAGFGKSTLLEQALSGSFDSAWLSMTEAERDPGALLVRLVAAISQAAPGAGSELAESLAMATGPIDPQAGAVELVADLDRVLGAPLVIVIDDGERLEGADEALALVSGLIRSRGLLRLAVASRRRLNLKVAKASLAGAVTEMGADSLTFAADECAEVLQLQRGRPPEPEEVESVLAATEGWPLGVTLLAAAPAGSSSRKGLNVRPGEMRSRDALKKFFAEEVLEDFDPELRSAAIEASLSGFLSPSVAEALGYEAKVFDDLEGMGLAMRRPSDDGRFTYHPLLQEFLQERLADERTTDELKKLHAKLAPAAAADGLQVEAILHWLDAENPARAAELLKDEGLQLVHSSPALLRSLIKRLPAAERELPGIVLLDAQLASGHGEHRAAAKLAREAIAGLQGEGDLLREWMARFLLAEALYHLGDFRATAEWATGFDEPKARAAFIFGPAVGAAVAACLASDGDFAGSDELAKTVSGHPDGGLVDAAEALRLAYMDLPLGRIEESIERLRASLAELEHADPFSLRLYTMSWLGFMLEEAGRTEEVLEIAERLAEDASGGMAPFMVLHARNWRAQQNAAAGRLRDAEADLARGGPATPGWLGYDWDMANAAVAALRGEATEAAEAAERSLAQVATGSIVFRFWAAADLIPVLADVGRAQRAMEVAQTTLEMIDEKLPGENGRFLRARMLALTAWLQQSAGETETAIADLVAAWREAGPEMALILRRQWHMLEPVVLGALESGALDPAPTVGMVAKASPAGSALATLARHGVAEVRRAAIEPAVASGDPEAFATLAELALDADPEVGATARRLAGTFPRTAPPLDFTLLGGFSLRRGAWRAGEADWGRPAAARLVRFLLVNRPGVLPEDAILEALWPELTGEGARRSLRVAASRARKVLDLPGADVSAIEVSEGCYTLVLGERDSSDSDRFESAAARALADQGPGRQPALEQADRLWGGYPLPVEQYSDWATAWRERLIDRQIEVLANLTTLRVENGDFHGAIESGRQLVSLDDLNEDAHRLIITAYARAGRTGQALHQYLVCRRALVSELGVEPAVETSALQARVLAGEPV